MSIPRYTDTNRCGCGVGAAHYGNLGIYIPCAEVAAYWAAREPKPAPQGSEPSRRGLDEYYRNKGMTDDDAYDDYRDRTR